VSSGHPEQQAFDKYLVRIFRECILSALHYRPRQLLVHGVDDF